MQRDEFLKTISVLGLGAFLGTSILGACDENGMSDFDPLAPLGPVTFEGNALVIGAGAAGLAAAKTLLDEGIEVQVLEASSIHGGRVRRNDSFADFPIDLGGRWIHGQRAITRDFADELGMDYQKDDTFDGIRIWYKENLRNLFPEPLVRFYAKINGSSENLSDISFMDVMIANNYDPDIAYLVESVAAEYGTSADRISAKINAQEGELWSSGGKDFAFKETYYDLVDRYFAQPLDGRIQYDTPVARIDHSGDRVIVTDRDGNNFEADRVIITVPVPIMKAGSIEFIPSLPSEKVNAFQNIGMDAGMKVIMKFNQELFPSTLIGGSKCAVYNNMANGKDTNQHVIMGFPMGEQADYLATLDDATNIQALLDELDLILGGTTASDAYLEGFVQDWSKEEFIGGAYSYPTVGMGDARAVAAATIDNKLFFAGEAMNLNGHNSTVHGAIESGVHKGNLVLTS